MLIFLLLILVSVIIAGTNNVNMNKGYCKKTLMVDIFVHMLGFVGLENDDQ